MINLNIYVFVCKICQTKGISQAIIDLSNTKRPNWIFLRSHLCRHVQPNRYQKKYKNFCIGRVWRWVDSQEGTGFRSARTLQRSYWAATGALRLTWHGDFCLEINCLDCQRALGNCPFSCYQVILNGVTNELHCWKKSDLQSIRLFLSGHMRKAYKIHPCCSLLYYELS